jgi:hypothetical protein
LVARTTESVVRFAAAFTMPGIDGAQPAGDYRVDQDEETIEGISRLAWRRVGTFIHLPAISVSGPLHQMVPIDWADLEAALLTDEATK